MEKSIEWKKKKYLQACRILDSFDKSYNFCNVRKENGKITCNGVFKHCAELCCTNCGNLTETGCSVASLMCKMSYCYIGNGPEMMGLTNNVKVADKRYELLEIIHAFFKKHDIPCYRRRLSMELTFDVYLNKVTLSDIDIWTAQVIK